MIPQDLHYEWPHVVYLIPIALLILILFFGFKLYRDNRLNTYAENLKGLLDGEPDSIYWMRSILFALVWLAACIALMQPIGSGRKVTSSGLKPVESSQNRRKLHDVLFLIDASASMGIADGRNGSTRLAEAQEIAKQILENLQGQQVAVSAFTGDVTQLSPPTLNLFYVAQMIDYITLKEGGSASTDLNKALEYVREKFLKNSKSKQQTIILLSDGGDAHSIQSITGSNTRLFTVGIGTPEGGIVPNALYKGEPVTAKLNQEILQSLAEQGRGRFYPAYRLSVKAIAEDILRIMSKDGRYLAEGEMPAAEQATIVYNYYYQVPLAIAVLLLMLGILLSRRLKLFLVALFLPYATFATDLQDAAAWYEAKGYSQAIDTYQKIMASPLTDWEETVVRYNMGTASTAAQDWSDAVASFRTIPITGNPSPWLQRLVQTNMAIARFEEAHATELLPKKIYALRQALVHIDKALEWSCKVNEFIGYADCAAPIDLEQMRALSENALSDALLNLQRYRVNHANFLDGIPLLLSQVESVLQNILFLKEQVEDPQLRNEYKKVFLYEAETWIPLWEQLNARVDPPTLFLAARKSYLYSQVLLQEGNLDEAEAYAKEALSQLKSAMKEEFGSVEEIELLQSLQRSYQQTLLQEPVQLVALVGLIHKQNQIEKILGKKLNNASVALVQATKLQTEGKQVEAQIQLEVAFEYIRTITRNMATTLSTVSVLENAIEAQEHALNLSRIASDSQSALAIEQRQAAQEQVIESVSPFIDRVIAEQQAIYDDTGVCLQYPWEAVVPAYYNGLQAARTALTAQDPVKWQEQALSYWQEALELLKEDEQVEEKPEERKEENTLLENLQQMNQMDIKPQTKTPMNILEDKPW